MCVSERERNIFSSHVTHPQLHSFPPHTQTLSPVAPSCTPAPSRTSGPHTRFHTLREFLASSGLSGESKRVWAKSPAPGQEGLGPEKGIEVSFSE